ncbi:hypothetical protein ACOIDN_31210, partial [Klebsiella pneumoniae]|uniref:hypothetical protein n=2 Tax=Enterobacterales TaxID=91347 RepID=UPI003B59814A
KEAKMWLKIFNSNPDDINLVKINQLNSEELETLLSVLLNKNVLLCWGGYDNEGNEVLVGGTAE